MESEPLQENDNFDGEVLQQTKEFSFEHEGLEPKENFDETEIIEDLENVVATEENSDLNTKSDNVQEESANSEPNAEEKTERLSKLPLSRIKQIMKMDPEVSLASQEAVFTISKSTELFIQILAKQAYYFTMQSKKKTIQKKDVESAVSSVDYLEFLDGAMDF